ncbi:unnamed protein product, partial [Ixodes hexagonus]
EVLPAQKEHRVLRAVRSPRTPHRRVSEAEGKKMQGLRDAKPTGGTCVHADVQVMRQGTPHGRPEVQREVQDAVHCAAEKMGEKENERDLYLKRGEENFPRLSGGASRSRSRSRAEGRRSRLTSRAGERQQSRSRRGREHQVSWAGMVSSKAPQNKGDSVRSKKNQVNELAEIKALLRQALEENRALREELNRLKEGTRERAEVVRAPDEMISAES